MRWAAIHIEKNSSENHIPTSSNRKGKGAEEVGKTVRGTEKGTSIRGDPA